MTKSKQLTNNVGETKNFRVQCLVSLQAGSTEKACKLSTTAYLKLGMAEDDENKT